MSAIKHSTVPISHPPAKVGDIVWKEGNQSEGVYKGAAGTIYRADRINDHLDFLAKFHAMLIDGEYVSQLLLGEVDYRLRCITAQLNQLPPYRDEWEHGIPGVDR